MSDPPTPQPSRAAATMVRLLGLMILFVAFGRAAFDFAGVFRYFRASTFWMSASGGAVVWIPCILGGIALLRMKEWGFFALYASLVLALTEWTVSAVPYFQGVLKPRQFGWLFGGGELTWLLNLVAAVFLVRAHVFVREATAGWEHSSVPSTRQWLLAVLILAVLLLSCRYGQGLEERKARAIVQAGIIAFDAGDSDEALSQWRHAVAQYPCTPAWGVAVFNSGKAHRGRGDFQEAIDTFEMLLPSGANDFEPSSNLMEAYQNYRHYACVQIAGCYEDARDYAMAIRYVKLAEDRYPYKSWCGTCLWEEKKQLEERTQRLRQKLRDLP